MGQQMQRERESTENEDDEDDDVGGGGDAKVEMNYCKAAGEWGVVGVTE
jgi:hypothetical protein